MAAGHINSAANDLAAGFCEACYKTVIRTIFSLHLFKWQIMRSSNIKPISYLKANAAEVLKHLTEQREPFLITQNGEARAVMQDIASYENTQEALALLKILALGNREIEEGKVAFIANAVRRFRAGKIRFRITFPAAADSNYI